MNITETICNYMCIRNKNIESRHLSNNIINTRAKKIKRERSVTTTFNIKVSYTICRNVITIP